MQQMQYQANCIQQDSRGIWEIDPPLGLKCICNKYFIQNLFETYSANFFLFPPAQILDLLI